MAGGDGWGSSNRKTVDSQSALAEKKMYGTFDRSQSIWSSHNLSRGAYCSMVLVSLLALPPDLPPNAPARRAGLRSFTDGLPEYLSRCKCHARNCGSRRDSSKPGQTFEGGISGAPQTEAHGAYAFCALACLCILGPPQDMIPA